MSREEQQLNNVTFNDRFVMRDCYCFCERNIIWNSKLSSYILSYVIITPYSRLFSIPQSLTPHLGCLNHHIQRLHVAVVVVVDGNYGGGGGGGGGP